MSNVTSYWEATAQKKQNRTKLTDHIKIDVVVIDGGFGGLATAYYLSKAGVSTILLEQNTVGWGASGRNAGMLTTGFKNSAVSLAKKRGLDKAKELIEMSVDCIELVDKIAKEEDIDCSINYK